jgi:hypothetical protein
MRSCYSFAEKLIDIKPIVMQNSKTRNQLMRFAFIAGPLLMLIASLVRITSIHGSELLKPDYMEGIIGCYGIVLFIPIYWELSRVLSAEKRKLAIATYITGLLGAATGYVHMYNRIYEYELRLHGASDAVWRSFGANPGAEILSVGTLGILFPLTSVLLGIGFMNGKIIKRWMAIGLILPGILFPAAMITESPELMRTTYPAACLCWMIVLGTYAIKYMQRKEVDLSTQTA